VCLLTDQGELIDHITAPPDGDGVRGLARRVMAFGAPVRAVIESMNGARFVRDTLEEHGWDVLIADAQKVRGLAPLACKTDKIDARVLAELSWRDLVPAIWLPDPTIRRERELARFRLHLVRHRTSLKNRVHATLITFGKPCPVSDLFGHAGRDGDPRPVAAHRRRQPCADRRRSTCRSRSSPSSSGASVPIIAPSRC
jgi:transposase